MPNAKSILHPSAVNGSGNGKLLTYDANFRSWQHLHHAGLVTIPFTGVVNPVQPYIVLDQNTPAGSYGNGETMWWAEYIINGTNGSYYTYIPSANYLILAGKHGSSGNPNFFSGNLGMQSGDVRDFDEKMDDGKALSGKMQTQNWNPCVTEATNTYRSSSRAECHLYLRID